MKVGRIVKRQTLRAQNAQLKATLTTLKTVDRAYKALEEAFRKGFAQGFEAGQKPVDVSSNPTDQVQL